MAAFFADSCGLLSFKYLWTIGNSKITCIVHYVVVVVCFHLSIFEPLETVRPLPELHSICCGLLSFKYLWTIGNSLFFPDNEPDQVVVCFHLSIFEPLETVNNNRHRIITRCGLLSFKYLWTIGNSKMKEDERKPIVVVCFHLSIFEPLETVAPSLPSVTISCGLLSFKYLWTIGNSSYWCKEDEKRLWSAFI